MKCFTERESSYKLKYLLFLEHKMIIQCNSNIIEILIQKSFHLKVFVFLMSKLVVCNVLSMKHQILHPSYFNQLRFSQISTEYKIIT